MDKIKVSCLPADLVSAIDVDISTLKTFDDRIHVGDIALPNGLTLVEKPDEVVASVAAPRSEAELESLSEKPVAVDVANVEVVKKERAVDDETAEAAADQAKSSPPNK